MSINLTLVNVVVNLHFYTTVTHCLPIDIPDAYDLNITITKIYHVSIHRAINQPSLVYYAFLTSKYYFTTPTNESSSDMTVSLTTKSYQPSIIVRDLHDTYTRKLWLNYVVGSGANCHMYHNKHIFISMSTYKASPSMLPS